MQSALRLGIQNLLVGRYFAEILEVKNHSQYKT